MADSPNPPTSPERYGDRPALPVLAACGCGPSCRCGCQSGSPCACRGGCGC